MNYSEGSINSVMAIIAKLVRFVLGRLDNSHLNNDLTVDEIFNAPCWKSFHLRCLSDWIENLCVVNVRILGS